MKTLITVVALIFSLQVSAQEEKPQPETKAQPAADSIPTTEKSKPTPNSIPTPAEMTVNKPPVIEKPHYEDVKNYFSYSFSNLENSATTVVCCYEVEYDDSTFQRVQFQRKFKKVTAGLGFDVGEDASKVLSLLGYLGFDNWLLAVEKAKLSGRITESGSEKVRFEENDYSDFKLYFLSPSSNPGGDQPGAPSGLGFQYLTYERPSAITVGGVDFYDPKALVTFIGLVFELDSIKSKMLNGKKLDRHDWYFFSTTAMGYGTVKMSSLTRNQNDALATPSETEFSGIGVNGEYELGYVFSFEAFSEAQSILKVGYRVQLEGPTAMDFSTFDDDVTTPSEQLLSHGIAASFATAF